MALTKNEIINQVREQSGMPKDKCASAVESTFEIVKAELEKGNKVSISGFGKWAIREKRSRNGRNPKTGEPIIITSRKVVTFKCSPVLKEQCNP